MDKEQEVADKRFEQFEEVFNAEGVAIGFTLPGSDFLFKYDADGGWKDQKGNLYNSAGVLVKAIEEDEDNSSEDDEEILDEFERMLEQEQQGVVKSKQKPVQSSKPKPKQSLTFEEQASALLEDLKADKNVRKNLPKQLIICFKMRSKFYQRVKLQVQNAQSLNQANQQIKKIRAQVEQATSQLKSKNPWINETVELQYSGYEPDDVTFDRYWYGYAKATAENYLSVVKCIRESSQFSLLEHKTLHALKSRFFMKKKMEESIAEYTAKIEGCDDNDLVKVTVNNLPENFPCSLIVDLIKYSGTSLDDVQSITLIDDYTAELMLSKRGALNFFNIEGYCHDHKLYIDLEPDIPADKPKIKKAGMFKIGLEKDSIYKTHVREMHDTLALLKSREQVIRLYTEEEEKTNGGFRLVVGSSVLRRVLMFRGNSLSVLKVQLF